DDLERLLAGVGLGNQQVVDVDSQLPRILGVERVLGVDVRRDTAGALHIGYQVKTESGLARRLGTVDLGDAAARNSTDAGSGVEVERPGGYCGDLHPRGVGAHSHDGALAELLLDLGDGEIEGLLAVGVGGHADLFVGAAAAAGGLIEATEAAD